MPLFTLQACTQWVVLVTKPASNSASSSSLAVITERVFFHPFIWISHCALRQTEAALTTLDSLLCCVAVLDTLCASLTPMLPLRRSLDLMSSRDLTQRSCHTLVTVRIARGRSGDDSECISGYKRTFGFQDTLCLIAVLLFIQSFA